MPAFPYRFLLLLKSPILLAALFLLWPQPAHALQTHLGLEGIYVHQGAHIFFTLSMIIFSMNIRRSPLSTKKPWRFFLWGALLLAFWNLWAFSGHIIEYLVPAENFTFTPTPFSPGLVISSWREMAYFFLQMDHILCLPSLVCFYLALKAILHELPAKNTDPERRQP
ncbi:MAG: hypothetical protein V1706_12625 [Pseudomonadota bacterium]